MSSRNHERDNIFHERTKILTKEGYCGFSIRSLKKEWKGAKVTAYDAKGRKVTGRGETIEEAYEQIIEAIDQIFDEQH